MLKWFKKLFEDKWVRNMIDGNNYVPVFQDKKGCYIFRGDKKVMVNDTSIEVGCFVVPNDFAVNLKNNYIWPKKVTEITDGPDYAGGKFIHCGKDGFYINALHRL